MESLGGNQGETEMKRVAILLMAVLLVGSANAMVNTGQGNIISADLGVINLGPGFRQASLVGQTGGSTFSTDGVSTAGTSTSGMIMEGITMAGPGMATTSATLAGGQTAGGVTNASGNAQGNNLGLGTLIMNAPGGSVLAQNSGIANQTSQTITPTTMTSSSNTVAASTMGATGPCAPGVTSSSVNIEICQSASAIAACPINPCPPCPPAPCNPCW